MKRVDAILEEKLDQLIQSMGYELIGCELAQQGRQIIFRLFIDSEKGVTVEDCSKVSHQVGAFMDVEDPLRAARYHLEVSSPGLDRPLFKLAHFAKFVGKQIKVRLQYAIDQRKQCKGLLQRIDKTDIYLLLDDTKQEIKLPFSAIEKANVIGEINFKKTEDGRV